MLLLHSYLRFTCLFPLSELFVYGGSNVADSEIVSESSSDLDCPKPADIPGLPEGIGSLTLDGLPVKCGGFKGK